MNNQSTEEHKSLMLELSKLSDQNTRVFKMQEVMFHRANEIFGVLTQHLGVVQTNTDLIPEIMIDVKSAVPPRDNYFKDIGLVNATDCKAVANAVLRLAYGNVEAAGGASFSMEDQALFFRKNPSFEDFMKKSSSYPKTKGYPETAMRALEFVSMRLGRHETFRDFVLSFNTKMENYSGDAAVAVSNKFGDDPALMLKRIEPPYILASAFDQFTIGRPIDETVETAYALRGWNLAAALGE